MQIGRFFSLQRGRVGQYLSPRVLVVRTPFQKRLELGEATEVCYFGFEKLNKAQEFSRYLAGLGYPFLLRSGQTLQQYPYELKLWGHADLARVLAYWDRMDQQRVSATTPLPKRSVSDHPVRRDRTPVVAEAIAA